MRNYFVLAFALALAALVCAPLAPRGGGRGQARQRQDKFRRSARPLAGRYVVMFDDEEVGPRGENSRAPEFAAEIAARHGARVLKVFRRLGQGFSAEMSEEAAVALSRDPRVLYVEEDGEVRAASVQQQGLATQQDLTIDQNQYGLWGLDRIDHHEPYLDWKYSYRRTGAGVTVYVFDTGIRTSHAEFGGRASVFYDALGGDGQDCNNHGTAVAGTIGGSTYGVAKGVWLRSVRVLDCQGVGAESDIIDGLDVVTGDFLSHLPAVANMSFTGPVSETFDAFLTNAMAMGLTIVAAAGDTNEDACNFSPGHVPGVHTI
ncbi:MAG TPA: S8 family peptidase, partial [Pyrinomonadaceae bacterium]